MSRYIPVALFSLTLGIAGRAAFDYFQVSQGLPIKQLESAAKAETDTPVTGSTATLPSPLSDTANQPASIDIDVQQSNRHISWQNLMDQLTRIDKDLTDRRVFLELLIQAHNLPEEQQFDLLDAVIDGQHGRFSFYLMSQLAQRDPYTALSFLQSTDLSRLSEGGGVIRGFVRGFIEYSPQDAWHWTQTPGNEDIKALAGNNLQTMQQDILRSAAEDPELQFWALQASREAKDPKTLRIGEWLVTRSMMRSDRQRTLNFAIDEYRQSNEKRLLNTALRSWAKDDTQGVAEFMLANLDLVDSSNANNLARQLRRAGDKDTLVQLYANIQNRQVKQSLGRFIERWEGEG